MKPSTLTPSTMLAAVLTGLVVPFLFFGRAVISVPLLAAILIVALWLPGRGDYWRQLIKAARSPVGLLFLVTLALWIPSIFFLPFPLRSFEAWVRIPVFVGAIIFLWAMLSENREALHLTFKALLIASAVVNVLALASLTFAPEVLYFVRNKLPPIRGAEILKEFGSVAILLVPALLLAGRRLRGRWPVLAAACVVGLLVIIWMTYNRSAMVGLFAMLLVGGLLIMVIRRNVAVNVVISVGFIAVTVAMVVWLYTTRGYIDAPAGTVAVLPPWLIDYQRQTIWAHAIDMAMRSPWFGNGINVINLLPGAEVQMPRNNLNIIPSHPHNWLVEVFAETGVIGALALLTLVVTLWCGMQER